MANTARILNGNINPYSENAVVVDSTPIVQYQLQQKAKQDAIDVATEKHLRDLSNIDNKGMRSQDIPEFYKKVNNSVSYYQANRENILHPEKDNFASRKNYENMVQDAKLDVASSLESKDLQKAAYDYLAKKQAQGLKLSFSDMALLDKLDAPIHSDLHYKNPTSKQKLGVLDFDAIIKPVNKDEVVKHLTGGLQRTEELDIPNGKRRYDNEAREIKIPTRKSFTGKDYDAIVVTAPHLLAQNPAMAEYINNMPPNEYGLANEAFKQKTGKNIDPNNFNEMAMGWTLANIPQHIEGQRITKNQLLQDKAALNLTEEKMKLKNQYDKKHTNAATNEVLKNIYATSVPIEAEHKYMDAVEGSWYKEGEYRVGSITPSLQKALTTSFRNPDTGETEKDVAPEGLIISKDGKRFAPKITFTRWFIQTDKGYSPTQKNGSKVTATTPEAVQQVLVAKPKQWYTASELAAEIQKTFPKGEGNVDYVFGEDEIPKNTTQQEIKKKTPKLSMK